MVPSMINNLSLDELESYTEELIRSGDYPNLPGPVIIAVLNKWIEFYSDSESAAKLEDEIVTIRGFVDNIIDACDEIKGMRNE